MADPLKPTKPTQPSPMAGAKPSSPSAAAVPSKTPQAAGSSSGAAKPPASTGGGGAVGGAGGGGKVPIEELRGRRLGRILIKLGKVTREQVHEALDLQQQQRVPIGQLLIELGYVKQDDVNEGLAAQAGMETLDLDRMEISAEVVRLLPAETAQAYHVMPIKYEKETNTLTVALKTADNFRAVDDLRLLMGFNVKSVVANAKQVDSYIQRFYSQDQESLETLITDMAGDSNLAELQDRGQSIDLDQLLAAAEDNKVKRLLNLVLLQAIKDKASDIHFEPFEEEFKMRYRVDGVLYEMIPPPKHLAWAITSRVKVMANLDIAERRMPQDGRIELQVGGAPIDLRISTLPTMFGESVVMRVLDRGNVALDLEKVGLRGDDLDTVRQLMNKPNGIVIVTGPTGSGKTTTLYSALNELNTVDTKILTAEDPVEYDIDGLVQVQVNSDVGLTFAKALRSFLRQDPDIILVGETRDLETAQIAVQASLTGHLVFSTLHTNDAPSSIARLLDLGLEPFLLTATLEGIIAQRLVRRICLRCKEEFYPTEEQLMELQLTPEDVEGRKFYRGAGCEYCNHSGYKGRLGLYEIMVLDDELKELVMQHASTQVLRNEARKRGMRTLRQAGLMGIYDGITSVEEVVRETVTEDE
jgi:type IV pilus assembly protein PilB